jgi:hypothetical protein
VDAGLVSRVCPCADIKVCIDLWETQSDELKAKWATLASLGWDVVDIDYNKCDVGVVGVPTGCQSDVLLTFQVYQVGIGGSEGAYWRHYVRISRKDQRREATEGVGSQFRAKTIN